MYDLREFLFINIIKVLLMSLINYIQQLTSLINK